MAGDVCRSERWNGGGGGGVTAVKAHAAETGPICQAGTAVDVEVDVEVDVKVDV